MKCYLNISNFFCHGSKDKFYASMIVINLASHNLMLAKIQCFNESVENMLPCENITVTGQCFLIEG